MRKWTCSVTAIVALLAVLSVFFISQCLPGRFSHSNYMRIKMGMTLGEVEALLGPGTEVGREQLGKVVRARPGVTVPPAPPRATARGNYPTELRAEVEGDRFFRWLEDPSCPGATSYIIVGFEADRVCDKTYWSYSL